MKKLIPIGGTSYSDAKREAQKEADKIGKELELWFNVRKGENPEIIKPKQK